MQAHVDRLYYELYNFMFYKHVKRLQIQRALQYYSKFLKLIGLVVL